MTLYCEREDVLRVLGGTLENVQSHLDRQLWDGGFPLTAVTVDLNTFDVPDTVLARIDKQIEFASSRLDTAILAAYKATPPVTPPHLTLATAQIAALECSVDDGTRTESLRRADEQSKAYFDRIANYELDLGITKPRPVHRVPAVMVSRGVGGRGRRGRSRSINGCCDPIPDPCDY